MSEEVEIEGLRVQLVSPEEAEQTAMVACMPADQVDPTVFADNVLTECSQCGRKIVHRPHAPKKPPKICVPCVMIIAQTNPELLKGTPAVGAAGLGEVVTKH